MLVFFSQALEPLNSKTPGSESISVHIPIAFTTMVGVPDPLPRWESALTEPFEAFAFSLLVVPSEEAQASEKGTETPFLCPRVSPSLVPYDPSRV